MPFFQSVIGQQHTEINKIASIWVAVSHGISYFELWEKALNYLERRPEGTLETINAIDDFFTKFKSEESVHGNERNYRANF